MLSHVVFIHDYLQLVFQDESFSIYNLAEVECGGDKVRQGHPGFCDAVVGLIGQRVIEVSCSDAYALRLSFEEGAHFTVRDDDEAITGPEAFQFIGKNQPPVIDQNT